MGRCPNCRRPVDTGDTVCGFCGEQLDQQRSGQDTKSNQEQSTHTTQSGQQRNTRRTQSSQQSNAQTRGNRRCPKCRRPINPGDSVCDFCGKKLDKDQTRPGTRQQRSEKKGSSGGQTPGSGGNTRQSQDTHNRKRTDTQSGNRTRQSQTNTTESVPGNRGGQRGQSTGATSQSEVGQLRQSQTGRDAQPTQHHGQRSPTGGQSSRKQQGDTKQAHESEKNLAKYIIPGIGVGALAFLLGTAVRAVLSMVAVATQDEEFLGLGYEDTGVKYWLVDQVVAHPMVIMESSETQLDGTTIIQEVPALGVVFVALVALAVIVFSYLFAKQVPETGGGFTDMKIALIFAVGYTVSMTAVAAAIEAEVDGNLFGSELQSITLAADPLTAVVSGFVVSCAFSYIGAKLSG